MTPPFKRVLFPLLALLFAFGVCLLLAEGVYALGRGSQSGSSLAYELYARWFADRSEPPYDAHDPTTRVVTSAQRFAPLIELFKANGVGMGNSPFVELKRDEVAINAEVDGCLVQKPNLRKTMASLRSNAFNTFDQPTYFHDSDRTMPEEVRRFFDRYGFRPVELTTNAEGERLTLPAVVADDVVLIAGDSIANGAMLDDAETIASRLQQQDRTRRYVNLGIGGAGTSDIQCALEKAGARYSGRVRELIYVFCENDFKKSTGRDVVDWLVGFKEREKIDRVAVMYMPYIYNVLPEVTRIPGRLQYDFPTYRNEKKELLAAARAAGFATVDYSDLTTAAQVEERTLFAALALYVDQAHPSPAGVDRLVAAYRGLAPASPR